MSPTVLLADPSVRLAGLRPRRTYVRAARQRRRVRWGRWFGGVVLAGVLLALVFLQTWPPLATVMSGSMAPTIDTGDVVLLKRLDRPARVGDVVSIPVPDEARSRFGYPPVVIHRIIAIDAAGSVKTKGDARKQPDPFTVPRTALTTRVVGTIPAAGRGLAFLGSPLGLLWLAGGALLLIGMPLLERHREGQRRVLVERDGLHSALTAITAELAALRDEREWATDAAIEREEAAAERAAEARADAAERERLAAEAHQRTLAECVERERRAVAEADAALKQARAAADAVERHLLELPALLERAIADAFAAAAPPPPPPPAPFQADITPMRPATPSPFVELTPPAPATPDLLGCLAPASEARGLFGPVKRSVAWDAPPPDLSATRRFAPPVKTFFA